MSRINYPADWSQSDRDDLDVMFNQARISGLWFFHGGLSGPLWFSPDELQAEQKKGKFVWGAVNWSLRSPTILIEQLNQKIEELQAERRRVAERMGIKRSPECPGKSDPSCGLNRGGEPYCTYCGCGR